jgi:hypothetical protein
LFSETALEEPFAASEGDSNGFARDARDGRDRGREPRAMYTGRFVHSGMAREELSPIGIGTGSARVGSRVLGRGGTDAREGKRS